ncbi:uncharacterized protein JCM15063_001229 [Sporobolomyces koalae]|uniref:uncharacterized protein n=1 Tax=Sporobolomyces koalae TaxID=500713 RepID=UPI0031707442
MSALFPPIKPYKSEMFPVSDVHTLSIKQYGNPQGSPVVFVHGGPGGGCDAKDAQRFDPNHYRIILFDQRGSGDSTPLASLVDNTTQHLIDDMEKIRTHLGIEGQWHVFGGSWGSTLSLAYAQAHPDRVKSLVLRGIFTLRRSELEYFYQGPGTSDLFPEYWDDYIKPIPENERSDMISAYYKRLTSEDSAVRAEAGRAWSRWEMATSRIEIDDKYLERADEPGFADAFARIECHYFINAGFFPQDGHLLSKSEMDKIRHIPTWIVQGRYDAVCPARTAWDLHKAFPEAHFEIVTAGHSSAETAIERKLIDATEQVKQLD